MKIVEHCPELYGENQKIMSNWSVSKRWCSEAINGFLLGLLVKGSMVSSHQKQPWRSCFFIQKWWKTYEKQRQKKTIFCWRISVFFLKGDPFSLGWTGSVCCMFPKKFTKKHSSWPRGLPKKLTNDDFKKPNPPDQRNHNPQEKYHFFERQLEGGLHLKTSNGSAIVET